MPAGHPEILTIIPARGGSKGMPRKNVLPLAGKPLIAHTVEHSLSALNITRTVVSTDDDEIAKVAQKHGAEIVHRPAEIAGDTASSESALLHTLDVLADDEDYRPDAICFLQCTSPIRTAKDVDSAVLLWQTEEADSLVSVTPWHGLNWIMGDNGPQSATFDYRSRPRRQDLREEYRENGSIFIFKPWVLRETGNRLGGKIVLFEMDPLSAVETDTPDGFDLSECILKTYQEIEDTPQ